MASLIEWFQKIPRNTQTSVQRLGPAEWLRLIAIVIGYLVLRPYLMRLVERKQTSDHEKVFKSRAPVTPNTLRGEGEDDRISDYEEAEGMTNSYAQGNVTRRRQKQVINGLVGEEIRKAEDLDDTEDVEFLKNYCT